MGILKNLFLDKKTKERIKVEQHYKDVFVDLKKIRAARMQAEDRLSDKDLPIEDQIFYEEKISTYFKVQESIEKDMVRLDKGIYMGVGINLNDSEAEAEPIYLPKKVSNGHLGWQAASGSGKTVGMMNINNQLIAMNDNVIIVDPKGGEGQEVLASTLEAAYEADRMDDVLYFSPAHHNLSDQINPIFGMSNEQRSAMMFNLASMGSKEKFFPEQVELSTKAISASFEFLEKSGDPTGEKTARLIEYEVKKWKKRKSNKGIERKVMLQDEELYSPDAIGVATSESEFTPPMDVEYKFNWTLMTFADLLEQAQYSALKDLKDMVEGTVLPSGISEEKIQELEHLRSEALSPLGIVVGLGDQFYVKVASSFSLLLTQLSKGPVGNILCGCRINPMEVHLSDPDKRLIAVLQPFPLRYKNTSAMITKIFTMSLEAMIGRVGAGGRGKNSRTHLIVDEAGAAIYPGIETLFSQARGLGLTLWMYTQSFADWEKVLEKVGARIVMENMNTQCRGRMNDQESAMLVSREVGTIKEVFSRTMTGDTNGSVENRYMIDSEEVEIVPPSEVMRLETGSILYKMGKSTYLVDVPFYSGPTGVINMPEMADESLIGELIRIERSFETLKAPEVAEFKLGI